MRSIENLLIFLVWQPENHKLYNFCPGSPLFKIHDFWFGIPLKIKKSTVYGHNFFFNLTIIGQMNSYFFNPRFSVQRNFVKHIFKNNDYCPLCH